MKFFKRNWKWIVFLALVGAGFYFYSSKGESQAPEVEYFTEIATKRNVKREVSVTGSARAKETREIFSKSNEEVLVVNFDEGDEIKAGAEILRYDTSSLGLLVDQAKAQLLQAQAGLTQQTAGADQTDIILAEKDIASAEVALRSAEKNLENVVTQNQTQIDNADLRIKNSESDIKASDLNFQSTLSQTQNAITQAEKTLQDGLENAYSQYTQAWSEAVNTRVIGNGITKKDQFEAEADRYDQADFGNGDRIAKSRAGNAYEKYAQAVKNFEASNSETLQNRWTESGVAVMKIKEMETLIGMGQDLTRELIKIIDETNVTRRTPEASIERARAEVLSQEKSLFAITSGLVQSLQGVESASLALNRAKTQNQSQLNAARSQFDGASTQRQTAEQTKSEVLAQTQSAYSSANSEIEARKASLEKARANLARVIAKPRSVDTAGARASIKIAENQVKQAELNVSKATMNSPIDGVITTMNAKPGQKAPTGVVAVIQSQGLELIADISETDIGDVLIGQAAIVGFDAFTADDVFKAKVTKISPSEIAIGGVIYYRVTLEMLAEINQKSTSKSTPKKVLPGMTANIDLLVEEKEEVFAIEPQAVLYEEGESMIKILKRVDEETEETEMRKIELGLEGNTYVEVLNGIEEGDEIVLYEEEKKSGFGR